MKTEFVINRHQRDAKSWDEGTILQAATDEFYTSLGRLVTRCLQAVPMELQRNALERFQDAASVYGSNFRYRQEFYDAAEPWRPNEDTV